MYTSWKLAGAAFVILFLIGLYILHLENVNSLLAVPFWAVAFAFLLATISMAMNSNKIEAERLKRATMKKLDAENEEIQNCIITLYRLVKSCPEEVGVSYKVVKDKLVEQNFSIMAIYRATEALVRTGDIRRHKGNISFVHNLTDPNDILALFSESE